MVFSCKRNIDGNIEKWTGRIESYNKNNNEIELYVCIPNFNVSCYLSSFNDIFWNSEKLTELIGEVDGLTAAKAIEFINKKINLWD